MIYQYRLAIILALIILAKSNNPLTALDCANKQASMAAAIPVDTLVDDIDRNGNCTLREAIRAATQNMAVDACPAGSANEADTITFTVDGTIELMLGELSTDQDLIIEGNGRDKTIIDGGLESRIFHFSGGQLFNLNSLTLQHGYTDDFDDEDGGGAIYNATAKLVLDDVHILESLAFGPFSVGGAVYSEGPLVLSGSLIEANISELGAGGILVRSASVEIDNSIILNNHVDIAGSGGGLLAISSDVFIRNGRIEDNSAGRSSSGGGGAAVFNLGQEKTVHISGTVISGNSAPEAEGGGGLFCHCDLTLVDSTIANNQADDTGKGGGGLAGSGSWLISRSTISGNSALRAGGGAIHHDQGELVLTNSTISDNIAIFGGGLYLNDKSAVRHSTVTENQANSKDGGQAIYVAPSSSGVTIDRSIIAGNHGRQSCVDYSNLTSNGYNLFDDESCGAPQPTDLVGVDPHLGRLQDNGGPTETHALLAHSPAIDSASCSESITVDQRAIPRPQGGQCDSGSFEYLATIHSLYLPIILNSSESRGR